jgi:hypothetical protein
MTEARDPLAAALRKGHTATEAELPADHPARSAWGQAALTEIDRLRDAIRDTSPTPTETREPLDVFVAALVATGQWSETDARKDLSFIAARLAGERHD